MYFYTHLGCGRHSTLVCVYVQYDPPYGRFTMYRNHLTGVVVDRNAAMIVWRNWQLVTDDARWHRGTWCVHTALQQRHTIRPIYRPINQSFIWIRLSLGSIYTPWVKETWHLSISLPDINQFSKFFHRRTRQKICNKMIIKFPTNLKGVATLPCKIINAAK